MGGSCCSSLRKTNATTVKQSGSSRPDKTPVEAFTDLEKKKTVTSSGAGPTNGNSESPPESVDKDAATRMSSLTTKELEEKLQRDRTMTDSPKAAKDYRRQTTSHGPEAGAHYRRTSRSLSKKLMPDDDEESHPVVQKTTSPGLRDRKASLLGRPVWAQSQRQLHQ